MATRRARRGRQLRAIAPPFTVAAPSGARIRDRLQLGTADEKVLRLVGEHLGRLQRADLATRTRLGNVPAAGNQRAARKRALTAASSSRWAGAMTRASEDQYQLSLRCLADERAALTRAIAAIGQRLAVACGQRASRVRGYRDQAERAGKQRRLQVLTSRLSAAERRLGSGHPAIVIGGARLARARHNLADAALTPAQWRERWAAARLFLTADGESGAPHGNYTICVSPAGGSVTLVLPEPLRHLANSPRGRYRLSCTVAFSHRRQEWLDRVTANQAVRYDITHDPRAAAGTWTRPGPSRRSRCPPRATSPAVAPGCSAWTSTPVISPPASWTRTATRPAPRSLSPSAAPGRPASGTAACARPSARSSGWPASTAALASRSRTSASLMLALPGGRAWAGAGAVRGSAAPWPGYRPRSSVSGSAAWPFTRAWSLSRWIRRIPRAGALSTGRLRSSSRQILSSPGIMVLRWRSAGVLSVMGYGAGQA